jgi:transposase-like protein
MARGSKTIDEIAEELGIDTSLLYCWITQFNGDVRVAMVRLVFAVLYGAQFERNRYRRAT